MVKPIRGEEKKPLNQIFQLRKWLTFFDSWMKRISTLKSTKWKIGRSWKKINITNNDQQVSWLDQFWSTTVKCPYLINTTDDIKNGILHFVEDRLSSNNSENATEPMEKLNLPNYLRSFARRNVKNFLESALQALAMIDGHKYICRNGSIKIIDYQSTGVVQQNTEWEEWVGKS